MAEPILAILKFALLGLLYLFVFYALRALVRVTGQSRDENRSGATGSGAIGQNRGANPGTIWLIESPGAQPRSLPLTPELKVGRSAECDIGLPGDNFISQYHVRFSLRDGGCFVEDLGSTNGTYLNGAKLKEPQQVFRGDRVTLGKTVLELRK